jgi:hypothetical protein
VGGVERPAGGREGRLRPARARRARSALRLRPPRSRARHRGGLNADTSLLGLDYRPSDSQIYALGDDGQLYTLTNAGAATAVGSPQSYGDLSQGIGIDFNPQVDRLRIVVAADQGNSSPIRRPAFRR